MLDSLFNTELPLLVKLAVAFAIVVVLLLAVMWILKRLTGDRLGGASTSRGRQPRLAVIDAASVDGRRRLVLIRRDNVEHLVMIGGPTDVVIEQNIVRAVPVASGREAPQQRLPAEAAPPRVPAAEAPRVPVETPRAAPEASRVPVEPVRAHSDTLRAPADMPPPRAQRPAAPVPGPRAEPVMRRTPEFDRPRAEPEGLAGVPPMPEPRAPRIPPPRIEPEIGPLEIHPAPPTAESNLASMANKLESALRRPGAPARDNAPPIPPPLSDSAPPTAPEATGNGMAGPSMDLPHAPHAAAEKAASPESPATAESKSVFDSLEEEMASLLGRGADKPEKK